MVLTCFVTLDRLLNLSGFGLYRKKVDWYALKAHSAPWQNRSSGMPIFLSFTNTLNSTSSSSDQPRLLPVYVTLVSYLTFLCHICVREHIIAYNSIK